MNSTILRILATITMVASSLGQANRSDVPFTSAGLETLPGKDICSLQGKFFNKSGGSLDAKWGHSVEYLARDGVIALFLLDKSGPPAYCGTVRDVVDLTPLIKAGEVPY